MRWWMRAAKEEENGAKDESIGDRHGEKNYGVGSPQ